MSDLCALDHPHPGFHRDDEGWTWLETTASRSRHCSCAGCRRNYERNIGQPCPCPACVGPLGHHQVLANRYRPQTLDDLLGADEFKRYAYGSLGTR